MSFRQSSCAAYIVTALLPCVCAVWQFAAPPFGSALQGYRQQAQIYSALVERAQAAGVTNSIPSWTPSVVRGYWNCKAAKTDVQALLAADYWVFKGVEPATWIAGTNDFIRVGLTNDDLLTNLLDVAQLPTNFFTSTPLFGLSVSSNGWCGFTQALPQLVWTRSVPAITYTNEQKLAAVMDFGETPVYRAHTNDLWEMWSYDDYSGTNFYASSNALLASVGSLVATNADDFYYLTNAPTGRIGSGWERMVHQVKLDMSGYNHYDYIFDVGGDWTEYIEQAEPRTSKSLELGMYVFYERGDGLLTVVNTAPLTVATTLFAKFGDGTIASEVYDYTGVLGVSPTYIITNFTYFVTGSSGMITPPDPAPSWQWNFDEDTTTISMTNQTPASITNCWKKYGAFASASVSGSNIAYLVSVADLPKTSSNVVANTIATNLVYYTNDVGTSGGLPYSETRDINATVSYFQKVTTGWWEYYLESALILKRWDGAGGFLWK